MRRALLVLAFAASFLVGAWGFGNAAPGDLDDCRNNGTDCQDYAQIPGTPCWRRSQSRIIKPDGTPISACTPTTSTTVAPTTTIASTTVAPTTVAPTTVAPTTSVAATTSTSASSTSTVPAGAEFVETFDGNTGLDRFTWGVYHRHVVHVEVGTPEPVIGADNNAGIGGDWTADHDLACGDAHTQRPMTVDFQQDTTGANGWRPLVDTNVEQLVYLCRDHVMSTMGDISGFTVLWFAPDMVFSDVDSVSFDVNLTDLGDRKWWKVGVVSDALFNSSYGSGWNGAVVVPGHVVSDVGSSDLNGSLEGPDRLIATWSGGASTAGRQGMAVGSTKVPCGADAGTDKMSRFPVSFVDNGNGTVTFTVRGSSCTTAGAFPACPCRVVFYDQNYNPDKDGVPIGHTWHWDSIVVRG